MRGSHWVNMKNRNCCNCGAPLELGNYRCSYCGTLYLDLSMINFDNNEPFFLTIKKDNQLITQKVRPQTAEFEITNDTVYATDYRGHKLKAFKYNTNIETNIQFIAIPWDSNHYMEIREAE